jgi:hypothetical protein
MKGRLPLLAAVAVFCLSAIVVWPVGDIPLNDDWNFALATWHFADTGEFRFARLTGMSLRAQVVWGAAWTVLFGKSFEVLRVSTLFLALGCLVLADRVMRQIGIGSAVRAFALLSLAFHPIFFWASFTYMTHVPFVFLALLAVTAQIASLENDSLGAAALAASAAIAAYFVRQTGVAIPLVLALVLLAERSRQTSRWRAHLSIAILPIVLFVPLYLFTQLLSGYPEVSSTHVGWWRGSGAAGTAMVHAFEYFTSTFMYGAIFFLPLTVPLMISFMSRGRTAVVAWVFALIPFTWRAAELVALGRPFTFRGGGNVLVDFGLGPLTLRDTWILGYRHPVHLPDAVRAGLTFLAAVIAAALLLEVARAMLPSGSRQPAGRLLALHAFAGCAILVVSQYYFDRYSLDALWAVPFLAAASIRWGRPARVAGAVCLVLVAWFSVAATHDYLAWNRARWEAYGFLREHGVRLEQMDGGYEVNQYLLGGFDGEVRIGIIGMSVVDDRYVIAFNPVEGYRTMAAFPYRRYLDAGTGRVLALERVAEGGGSR